MWDDSSEYELDSSDEFETEDLDDVDQTCSECPECHATIYDDAVACPACGHYIIEDTSPFSNRPHWVRWLFVVTAIFLVLFIVWNWVLQV